MARARPTPRRSSVPDPAHDTAPSLYIARISRQTGREVPGPIDPDELLVHAHRDQHPAEVLAQFLGSRLVQLTGREGLVETTLRGLNTLGAGAASLAGGLFGSANVEHLAKRVLGVVKHDTFFRFREFTHL